MELAIDLNSISAPFLYSTKNNTNDKTNINVGMTEKRQRQSNKTEVEQ
jgi:hypothetical protein